ncbi:MAG: hypothetical protein LBI12_03965 [Treponema sp.]|jgi:predicted nucleic acid-binding protein|nr:hypothetical protein [Treponema sp.]
MMSTYIPKLYLDTTVFNFYFVEKDGKKQQDTHRLFDAIKRGKYKAYASQFVLEEIAKDIPLKYQRMRELIDKYAQSILDFDQRVTDLAAIYVENGIIPVKYTKDAEHIAAASVNKLDFVVSYNMGHIVKLKTIIGTGFANLYHGYPQIGLCTPTEVMNYGEN